MILILTKKTSVVDPERFIPDTDPALNFRVPNPDRGKSSGSMWIRIQPMLFKYNWKL